MPNDIDAVRELREYELRSRINTTNVTHKLAAIAAYHTKCVEHMPAILEALERVTGERDAAVRALRDIECEEPTEYTVCPVCSYEPSRNNGHARTCGLKIREEIFSTFRRDHPHLFKTESKSAPTP
jgi:hypothetical protein